MVLNINVDIVFQNCKLFYHNRAVSSLCRCVQSTQGLSFAWILQAKKIMHYLASKARKGRTNHSGEAKEISLGKNSPNKGSVSFDNTTVKLPASLHVTLRMLKLHSLLQNTVDLRHVWLSMCISWNELYKEVALWMLEIRPFRENISTHFERLEGPLGWRNWYATKRTW